MGRRNRERIERIQAGLENPIARTAVKIAARSGVVAELKKASTDDQVEVLSTTVDATRLGRALMKEAPGEMDKGIRKLQKEGRPVTVDELCREIRENVAGFRTMSENAGVPLSWYEDLAGKRMEAAGL